MAKQTATIQDLECWLAHSRAEIDLEQFVMGQQFEFQPESARECQVGLWDLQNAPTDPQRVD